MRSLQAILVLLAALSAVSFFQLYAQKDYDPAGYSISAIKTPDGVLFAVTGLDVEPDGTVWVATRLGEVWRLEKGRDWTRFAAGLHEPAGLLIEDDGSIVVAQKPELTRLVDLDGDGQADEYRHVASGFEFHDNYHEYHFGPVKDARGYYHGTLNLDHNAPGNLSLGAMGSLGGFRGWAYRVSPEGTFEAYAMGLRSPAGIGISPEGDIFCIDNQGDWVATSKMHLLEPGRFFGHPVSLRDDPGFAVEEIRSGSEEYFDRFREKPVVWIPNVEVANSPGNPVWDTTEGKFGPFAGQIFVGDQTQSRVFRISLQKVNGVYQGMVVNFLDGFRSGAIRLCFDPFGVLWVGQTARGWNAKGGELYGLEKVTWDGSVPFEIHDIKLTDTGFNISFTESLDQTQINLDTILVSRYHYPYTREYGAPKTDLESVPVQSAQLLVDGKTISVKADLQVDKVYEFEVSGVRSLNGRRVTASRAHYTLNQLVAP